MWYFCGSCLIRGHVVFFLSQRWKGFMIFGKSINGSPPTVRGCFCTAMPNNASLVFHGLYWSSLCREKCAKELLVVFSLIPASSADFIKTLKFLLTRVAATVCVWCLPLNRTAGIQTAERGITPKNYF